MTVKEMIGGAQAPPVTERMDVMAESELIPGRRESRARVAAAGLSDADIDRLIKQAQREVEPRI